MMRFLPKLVCVACLLSSFEFCTSRRIKHGRVLSGEDKVIVSGTGAEATAASVHDNTQASVGTLPPPHLPYKGFWSLPVILFVAGTPFVVVVYLLMTCGILTPFSYYFTDRSVARAPEEVVQPISGMLAGLFSLAVPTILMSVIAMVGEIVNLVFIGHVGAPAEIAAVGLGNTMQNCVGIYFGMGLTAALDTLASQAMGADRIELAVDYLQRCRAIVTTQLVWMWPILWFSESILLFIGENPEVAYNAGWYNKVSCFTLPFFFHMYASVVWLRNLGYVNVSFLVIVLAVLVQAPTSAFFIIYLRWGNFGAGLANLTAYCFSAICLSGYLTQIAKEKRVSFPSLVLISGRAFQGWWEYLKVAIPATLQTICEMWYFEVIMLFAGYLGQVAMASYVVTANWMALQAMFGLAMGFAVSTLVGQTVGSGKPLEVRMMTMLALVVTTLCALAICFSVLWGRYLLADFYTSEASVQSNMANLLFITCSFVVPDSCQMMMGGALRGLNRSGSVAVVFVVSYWLISLPLALALAFYFDLGVHGLLLANLVGTTASAFFFATMLMVMDFDKVAKEAEARMKVEEEKAK